MKKLTVREVPFDVSRAVAGESFDGMVKDFGRGPALFLMAMNIWAEWVESYLLHLRRTGDWLNDSDDGRTFMKQEARHAAALHPINAAFLGKDEYFRHPLLGRVSRLAHDALAPVWMGPQTAAEDETAIDKETLRRASLMTLSFETTFSLICGATACMVLDDEIVRATYMKHPGICYVLLYHSAEECEHSHVCWEYYERRYAPVRSAMPEFVTLCRSQLTQVKNIACQFGLRMGGPDPTSEVEEAMAASERLVLKRLELGDWDAYEGIKRACVTLWDDRWEREFRSVVLKLTNSAVGSETSA